MKLKVIDYFPDHEKENARACPWWPDFTCEDENGNRLHLDLLVDRDFPEDFHSKDFIGKTITIDSYSPYLSIAQNVQILDDEEEQKNG